MDDIKMRISEIEAAMNLPDFWQNKDKAQELIREMNELKDKLEGHGKHDKSHAIVTILAGAGGDDAEDFASMLHRMYDSYATKKGWSLFELHRNENDHGGFRNITFEVDGARSYGLLKHERGVHRLVRISPFNAKKLRHTSFAMVDVVPKIEKKAEMVLPEGDLRIDFTKSSGPGGQNVNKRETAVRVVHVPSGLSVHVDSERSQAQNRERAIQMLEGKIARLAEEAEVEAADAMKLAGTQEVAWGNQIRSYVLHPYKMVKDHRTDVEVRDVDKVLEDGDIDTFIEAEKALNGNTKGV